MNPMFKLLALALVLSAFYACDKDKTKPELPPTPIELSLKAKALIANSNSFGVELFTQTAQGSGNNMMLSPLSASIALTMLLNGSDAETFNQIRDMLGYPADYDISEINEAYKSLVTQLLAADSKVKLNIANAVFHRQDFVVKNPFIQALNSDFDAQVQSLDFNSPAALSVINNWASDHTNGKIPKVLDNIREDAVMFLMNALYFKGDWTKQFDKSKTSNMPFYLSDGSTVQASTMQHDKMAAIFYQHQDFTALEMPYGRRNFSMIVMLPAGDLSSFYQQFTPAAWVEMTTALNNAPDWDDFYVTMPKFRFEYETLLNDQLSALGMTDAFNPNLADFSKISDTQIYVDFVKQNTFVDVNEEGTEAAAVTTIGMVETSMPPMFVVDKPFAFAIRERTTNSLLFIGSVSDPR